MPRTFYHQTSFLAGMIDPVFANQVNSEFYKNALETAENVFITPQGGIRKRNGWTLLATDADSTFIIVPYQLSANVGYGLVLSNTGQIVQSDGTENTDADLNLEPTSTYYQYGNVIYFAQGFSTINPVRAITVVSASSVTAAWVTNSSTTLVPHDNTYVPTDGYAITSMTAIYRTGQTGITVSGANPGPFSSAYNDDQLWALDGVFKITGYTNNYTITCTCLRGNSSTSASNVNWEFHQNSETFGSDGVTVYGSRLVSAGYNRSGGIESDTRATLQISAVGDTSDYYPGPNADDAIFISNIRTATNGITWMYSGKDLVIGTEINVVSISSPGGGAGLDATNYSLQERSTIGGIRQTPISGSEGEFYYIDATQTQIRRMKFDERLQGYTNINITKNINTFTKNLIVSIAYASRPYSMIFAVLNNGEMLAGTFLDEDGVNVAWTKFCTNTNGNFKQVITLRNNNTDEIWAKVDRSGTYSIEKTLIPTEVTSSHKMTDGTSSTYTVTIKTFDIHIPVQNFGSYKGQKLRWVEPTLSLFQSNVPTVNSMVVEKSPTAVTVNSVNVYNGLAYYGNTDASSLTIAETSTLPLQILGIFGQIEYGG